MHVHIPTHAVCPLVNTSKHTHTLRKKSIVQYNSGLIKNYINFLFKSSQKLHSGEENKDENSDLNR